MAIRRIHHLVDIHDTGLPQHREYRAAAQRSVRRAGAGSGNAVTIPLKVLWSQIAYIGTVSSPVFLLIFTAQFTHRHRWLTRPNLVLLWLIPVVTLLLAATNGQHGLIWSGFEFATETRDTITYHHGPWFWVFVAFVSATFSAVLVLPLAAARRMHPIYRRQSLVILLSILLSTATKPILFSRQTLSRASPINCPPRSRL